MGEPLWPNLRREGRELYTRNADPGRSVYGEERREFGGVEYRQFDPWRSKLAAYILRDGVPPGLERVRRVLYLGGAHGTTVSHLTDLLPGVPIFVVEKSPTSFAALLALARARPTVLPILADAHLPERYRADVGPVDLIYQDVAQRDQAALFAENALACLRRGGEGLLMLKLRSVTQRRPVGELLRETRQLLAGQSLRVAATVDLAPFAREHAALRVVA
jgi:fibrillarin-like pre-rRNA processing protein